jgi:hypothetical protein
LATLAAKSILASVGPGFFTMTSACTILCPTNDFGAVLDAIQSATAWELSLEGTRDYWTRITVVYTGKQITFSGLVQVQPGDKFSRTVLSMHNYFRTVKTDVASNQGYVLRRIANVQMMIGVVADPEFSEDDSRFNILWHIAECMDALVFNGEAILDLQGQRILDQDGKFDVVVE